LVILSKQKFSSPPLKTAHVLCKRKIGGRPFVLPFSSSSLHFFKLNQNGVFLGGLYPRKQIKWLNLESYRAWEKQREEAGNWKRRTWFFVEFCKN